MFMKKNLFFISLILLLFSTSCSSDNHTYNNPNLLNVSVYFTVNTDLPQFNPLKFSMNPVFVDGYGNGGVIITNTGSGNYMAFDAADPNHPVESCSTLEIEGIEGVCQCNENNTYNLITGTAIESKSDGDSFDYTMKPYQVIANGDGTLTVKN